MKKKHWTQRPENKAKIKASAKKSAMTRQNVAPIKSKAERIIEKNLGGPKVMGKTRESVYSRAAAMAVGAGEVPKLMNFVAHQLLIGAMRGAQ